jgi:CBS domain containing-hemolysin-like protein
VSPAFLLGLVAMLIAANGFFVAAEFSLVAVRRAPIEDAAARGDRRARAVLHQLQRLTLVLSAAQFGITVTSLLVGFLAEGAIGDTLIVPLTDAIGLPPESSRAISIGAAFLLSTGVQMIVGELAPKNVAIAHPEPIARFVAPLMRVFGVVMGPVIRVFDASAGWVTRRVFRVEVVPELTGGHTMEELSRIIAASTVEGVLSDDQAEVLARAVGLWDRRASAILVPTADVVWLEATDTLDDLRRQSRDTGHSRFPVRRDDDVLGTVHVKDLLRADREPGITMTSTVDQIVVPCLIVPESEPLRRLLANFRAEHRTFAVVVDEYGTIVGILTLEDLLEQLVGDIEDEFDSHHSPSVRRLGPGRVRVAGRLQVDRLATALDADVPGGAYETVAGLVMDGLGRIPDDGETLDLPGLRLTVTRMDGVRIVEVEVQRTEGGT